MLYDLQQSFISVHDIFVLVEKMSQSAFHLKVSDYIPLDVSH